MLCKLNNTVIALLLMIQSFQLQWLPTRGRARSSAQQIRAVSTTAGQRSTALEALRSEDPSQQQGHPRRQPTLHLVHSQPQSGRHRGVHGGSRHRYVSGKS